MSMNISVNREIRILSLSFLLIFFGFNGIQQYITSFFSEAQMPELGFRSLILIYLFLILSNPLAAVLVSRCGAKKCMIAGSLFYSIFIVSLLAKSVFAVYSSSALLGAAASLLWTGSNSYLVRASEEGKLGANSGFFNSIVSLGSALGIVILGFLVDRFLFKEPFLVFSFFPFVAFLLLFKLKDIKAEQVLNPFRLIRKSITSATVLRLSSIWFVVNFSFGLVIGIIPIEIKSTLGLPYVGVLSFLFYIMPIFFSYSLGKLSDAKGRKRMIVFSYVLLALGMSCLFLSGQAFFLVAGVVLLALNWAVMVPILYALVGDVSTKNNLEFLTATFWMVQSMGVVIALIISQAFLTGTRTVYCSSIIAVAVSLLLILPLFRLKMEEIKEKISREVS